MVSKYDCEYEMILTDYDKQRYNRQMITSGWGKSGQVKLKSACVFIAGAGGLGSMVSIQLAMAGVGTIRICDSDKIELSNLNRQVLHTDARIGELKAISAEKTLKELNPTINISPFTDHLNEMNIESITGMPDIVVDCLDNFKTRYLLNAYCIKKNIPLIHGAIWGMTGQVTFIYPPKTPCLQCLFPKSPPKEIFPVAGITPGLIGCIQASEVLKYLMTASPALKGKLLIFDGEDLTFSKIEYKRNPSCLVCHNI